MKKTRFLLPLPLVALWPFRVLAETNDSNLLLPVFSAALTQVAALVEPGTIEPPRTCTTTLKIRQADGLSKELLGSEWTLAVQAPGHLRVAGAWDGQQLAACRDGQEVWINAVTKKFGLLAGSEHPAAHARYTHYHLADLLQPERAP
jgi:hypothetical protein